MAATTETLKNTIEYTPWLTVKSNYVIGCDTAEYTTDYSGSFVWENLNKYTNEVSSIEYTPTQVTADYNLNVTSGSLLNYITAGNSALRMYWEGSAIDETTSAGLHQSSATASYLLSNWSTLDSKYIYWPYVSERERKQQELRSKLTVIVKSRASVITQASDAELTALETLREMISESDFRRYLKYGFIMVRGESGDRYQIFRDKSHTKVWRDGEVVEEVCVRIRLDGVPPTDNVIAFMRMIEINEEEFLASGNRYKFHAIAA